MRNDGFTEGKCCSVTGAGHYAENVRTEGSAELGNFGRIFKEVDEAVNHAAASYAGSKDACGNN